MKKSLSIIFVTNNYTPYQGGVAQSVILHAQELRKRGHKVTIITLDFKNSFPEVDTVRIFCPLQFTYKKNPMAVPWRPQKALRKLLTQEKPDIIHVHHPFLLGPCALEIAKSLSIPTIFTYHTLYDHYAHYVPFPSAVTKPCISYLVELFCQQVDGIIAPSSFVQDRVQNINPTVKITRIPTPVSSLFLQPHPVQKSLKHPCHLLSVSRFTPEKNISFLLDVFASLPQEKFILTLAGYGSHYSFLRDYAYQTKKLSLKNVHFIEKPPKHKLVDLYRQADLFLFSSQSDTQGIVLAEAMASGCPVISLDGPGQRDLIVNGINGYLVTNQQEMKEKIEHVATNEILYQTLQRQSQESAQAFQPEHIINQLTDFYYKFL